MEKVIAGTAPAKVEVKQSKFVPGLSYEWKPEDRFILLGEEFSTIFHLVRALASSGGLPNSVNSIETAKAYHIMDALFLEGVEAGVITPKKDPAQALANAVPLPGQ